jgi:hypothetical protein
MKPKTKRISPANERKKAVQAVMDLYYALRSLKCDPKLSDLVTLAIRIKGKK